MDVGDTVWVAVPDWWDFWEDFPERNPVQGVVCNKDGRRGHRLSIQLANRLPQWVAADAVVDTYDPPPWKREPIVFYTKEDALEAQTKWRKLQEEREKVQNHPTPD